MKQGNDLGCLRLRRSMLEEMEGGGALRAIGRAFDKPILRFGVCCCLAEGFSREFTVVTRVALTAVRARGTSGARMGVSCSSTREIARHLDRAASTVGREVRRHGGRAAYRAHEADDHKPGSRPCGRGDTCSSCPAPEIAEVVASKLILEWSPEQISGG